MKFLLALAVMAQLSLKVHAHEGHAHAPGADAQHGGMLKEGKNMNIEFVSHGRKVELYPMTADGEMIKPADLKMQVTTKAPRGKAQPLELQSKGEHFTGTVKDEKAHRYELTVKAAFKGQDNSFTFQVEPER